MSEEVLIKGSKYAVAKILGALTPPTVGIIVSGSEEEWKKCLKDMDLHNGFIGRYYGVRINVEYTDLKEYCATRQTEKEPLY